MSRLRSERTGGDLGQTERYAIAAVDGDNTYRFPAFTLRSIWERMLFPLKRTMIEEYGLQLFGIRLEHHCAPYQDRDFHNIVQGLDLGDPLNSKVRFIISDLPFEKLPNLDDSHPILIAIELGDGPIVWAPHPLNKKCVHVKVEFERLADLISDIVLDISFTNSYGVQKIFSYLAEVGVTSARILELKAEFLRENLKLFRYKNANVLRGAPYVSFSAACRGEEEFGSARHLARFVAAWDEFIMSILSSTNSPADVVVNIVNDFPGFKRQLSPTLVADVVHKLSPGVHMLLVQRGGHSARTNPKFVNEIKAGFDLLEIRGRGSKKFGVFAGGTLPNAAKNLVRKRAAYAVRLHVGGGK